MKTCTCPRCGHTWSEAGRGQPRELATFFVPHRARSLNDRIVNSGPTRHAYRQAKETWAWHLRAARLNGRIPIATKGGLRRRVTLTRIYGGREREWDPDNWIGGAKVIVDALVAENLIADDAKAFVAIEYFQERGTPSGVRFKIEEI